MFNAIKSMGRLKIITLLLVVQMSLGLSLLINIASQTSSSMDKEKILNNMFDLENTYLVRIHDDFNYYKGELPAEYYFRHLDISKEIMNISEKKEVNNVFTYFSIPELLSQKLYEVAEQKYGHIASSSTFGMESYASTILIDENFYNKYSFKEESGRAFKKEDFNRDVEDTTIPIMLGTDYKDIAKVGDVYTIKNSLFMVDSEFIEQSINFEVIGFIQDGALLSMAGKSNLTENARYSSGLIAVPSIDKSFKHSTFTALYDVGIFVEVDKGVNKDELSNIVQSVIDKCNSDEKYKIVAEIEPMSTGLKAISNNLNNNTVYVFILGLTLTLLAVVGIVTNILGQLKQRRKEFGIKIVTGATISMICKEIVQEIFILVLGSVVISNIYMKFTTYSYKVDFTMVVISIIAIVILTLVTSIIPISVLRKNKPINLLKEGK